MKIKNTTTITENLENEYELLDKTFAGFYEIVNNPPKGSSFLLRDGRFLNLNDGTHTAFLDDCQEMGVSFTFIHGSAQLNTGTNPYDSLERAYASLPKAVTPEMARSLKKWLDLLKGKIEIHIPIRGQFKEYDLRVDTPDDIFKKIRRAYTTGTLVENFIIADDINLLPAMIEQTSMGEFLAKEHFDIPETNIIPYTNIIEWGGHVEEIHNHYRGEVEYQANSGGDVYIVAPSKGLAEMAKDYIEAYVVETQQHVEDKLSDEMWNVYDDEFLQQSYPPSNYVNKDRFNEYVSKLILEELGDDEIEYIAQWDDFIEEDEEYYEGLREDYLSSIEYGFNQWGIEWFLRYKEDGGYDAEGAVLHLVYENMDLFDYGEWKDGILSSMTYDEISDVYLNYETFTYDGTDYIIRPIDSVRLIVPWEEHTTVREELEVSDKDTLDKIDKLFGQEEVYMWSTYILPNGHFLNPDNAPDEYFEDEYGYSGITHEHEDFYISNKASDILDKYGVKMNVTYPYLFLPKERITAEQLKAIEKVLTNHKDSFDYTEVVPDGILLLSQTGHTEKVYKWKELDVKQLLKEVVQSYRVGFLEGVQPSSVEIVESLSTRQINEFEQYLKNNYIVNPIAPRGVILSDGTVIENPTHLGVHITHSKFIKELKGLFKFSFLTNYRAILDDAWFDANIIKVNGEHENYVVLTRDAPSPHQFRALEKWVDNFIKEKPEASLNVSTGRWETIKFVFDKPAWRYVFVSTGQEVVGHIRDYYRVGAFLTEDIETGLIDTNANDTLKDETYLASIYEEGKKVGWMRYVISYEKVNSEWKRLDVYIVNITIYNEHRNKGYGTKAIKDIVSKYKEPIYISADNPQAERLYSRLGTKVEYKRAPEDTKGNKYPTYKIEEQLLLENSQEKLGYRNNAISTGVVNLMEIILWEVFEMGNIGILDRFLTYEPYRKEIPADTLDQLEGWMTLPENADFLENTKEMTETDKEMFVNTLLKALNKAVGKDIRYGLWLGSERAIKSFYGPLNDSEEIDLQAYPISDVVITDMGFDDQGVLYGYESNPYKQNIVEDAESIEQEVAKVNHYADFNCQVTTEVPKWSAYILPDGRYLELRATEVEIAGGSLTISGNDSLAHRWYEGKIEEEDFSPTLLSAIRKSLRINDGTNPEDIVLPYVEMPESRLTEAQEKSLLKWFDKVWTLGSTVEVLTPTKGGDLKSTPYKTYNTRQNLPDDILKKMKRWYGSGVLVESLEGKIEEDTEHELLTGEIYYRYEIEGKGTLFQHIDDVVLEIESSEEYILTDGFLNDYEKQDALDELENSYRELENNLPIPNVDLWGDKFGKNIYRSAFSKEGLNKFEEELNAIKYYLEVFGYKLNVFEVKPKTYVYKDDYQIVYTSGQVTQLEKLVEEVEGQAEDSENNPLTQEQVEFFKDSKIRDEQGNLLVTYHGTKAKTPFEIFKYGDVGFHFGNDMHASVRSSNKSKFYLNIKNPLVINGDCRVWDAYMVLSLWMSDDFLLNMFPFELSKEDREKVLKALPYIPCVETIENPNSDHHTTFNTYYDEPNLMNYFDYIFHDILGDHQTYDAERYGDAGNVFLRELLTSKGYDGIQYINEYDVPDVHFGVGEFDDYSYIAFFPSQIKRIENKTPSSSDSINEGDNNLGNTFTFKGKKAWSGSVNTLDGIIEETHTYKQAVDADFHHSYYFSDAQLEKMEEGECVFFFVDDEGKIEIDPIGWGENIDKVFLTVRVKEQIKIIAPINEDKLSSKDYTKEEPNHKNKTKHILSKPTEEKVLQTIEEMADEDDMSYDSEESIYFDSPTIFITPSGHVLNIGEYDTHESFMETVFLMIDNSIIEPLDAYDYVVEDLGFITLNTGHGFGENRLKIVISKRPTQKQSRLLREWLDRRFKQDLDKKMYLFIKPLGEQKTFNVGEEDTKSIIRVIHNAFSFGILEGLEEKEDLSTLTSKELIQHLKDKFKKEEDEYIRSPHLLDDGTIIGLSKIESEKYSDGYAEHGDIITYLRDRGVADTNAPKTNISKFLWDNANAIRLYASGIDLPKYEPTQEQYKYLLNLFKYKWNWRSGIEIHSIDSKRIITYDTTYHSPEYVIGRIKRYYNTGELKEDWNEEEDEDKEYKYNSFDELIPHLEEEILSLDNVQNSLQSEIDNIYGPAYLTPEGYLIDIEDYLYDKVDADMATHTHFVDYVFGKEFEEEGILSVRNLNHSPIVILENEVGFIRFNMGSSATDERMYVELFRSARPTHAQYNELIKFFTFGNRGIQVYLSIGSTGRETSHTVFNPMTDNVDEFIKRIKRWYTTGVLVEELEDNVYYRGHSGEYGALESPNSYIWLTDDKDYAEEYKNTYPEGKVSKVRLLTDNLTTPYNLPDDFDEYEPGDEAMQEYVYDEGYDGYTFEVSNEYQVICVDKNKVEVIEEINEDRIVDKQKTNSYNISKGDNNMTHNNKNKQVITEQHTLETQADIDTLVDLIYDDYAELMAELAK